MMKHVSNVATLMRDKDLITIDNSCFDSDCHPFDRVATKLQIPGSISSSAIASRYTYICPRRVKMNTWVLTFFVNKWVLDFPLTITLAVIQKQIF